VTVQRLIAWLAEVPANAEVVSCVGPKHVHEYAIDGVVLRAEAVELSPVPSDEASRRPLDYLRRLRAEGAPDDILLLVGEQRLRRGTDEAWDAPHPSTQR
jgi:hypothetical protein